MQQKTIQNCDFLDNIVAKLYKKIIHKWDFLKKWILATQLDIFLEIQQH